jgi:hypothetical protein
LKGEKEKSKTAVEKWGEIQRDFSFKVGLWNQLILGEAGVISQHPEILPTQT